MSGTRPASAQPGRGDDRSNTTTAQLDRGFHNITVDVESRLPLVEKHIRIRLQVGFASSHSHPIPLSELSLVFVALVSAPLLSHISTYGISPPVLSLAILFDAST